MLILDRNYQSLLNSLKSLFTDQYFINIIIWYYIVLITSIW